jgi:hypothetical protein
MIDSVASIYDVDGFMRDLFRAEKIAKEPYGRTDRSLL